MGWERPQVLEHGRSTSFRSIRTRHALKLHQATFTAELYKQMIPLQGCNSGDHDLHSASLAHNT
jgi:hypothetical protein